MYVCVCNAITDRQIREACCSGACCSMRELNRELGVGNCCGRCAKCARDLLRECNQKNCPAAEAFIEGDLALVPAPVV